MNVKKACEILDLDMHDPKWKDKIKLKYREKALLYHPDKNGGDPDSASKFVKVHEAYETLIKEKDVKKPSLEALVNLLCIVARRRVLEDDSRKYVGEL